MVWIIVAIGLIIAWNTSNPGTKKELKNCFSNVSKLRVVKSEDNKEEGAA